MKFAIPGLFFCLLIASCKNEQRPDVREFRQERRFIRFEQELFALDKEHPDAASLQARYGRFFTLYAGEVLQLGNPRSEAFPRLFSYFLRDSVMRQLYDSVETVYPDMAVQESELTDAFAYYAYYFPGRPVPALYTHISGFNQSIVADSAWISVSLDNYLGEECLFYKMLATPVPRYLARNMTPENIVRDLLLGWLTAEFSYHPLQNDLVSGMIHQGKLLYMLEKLLPGYAPERLFGFTREQWEWCRENEEEMWGFLIENEYLFDTGQMLLRKYLFAAPFSPGMPEESPGQAVLWNGYRIVGAYMKNRPLEAEALMAEQDYHKILREARYKP